MNVTRYQFMFLGCVAVYAVPLALRFLSLGYLSLDEYVSARLNEARLTTLKMVGLQPIVSESSLDSLIDSASQKWGVKKYLLHALANTESGKSPTAFSIKGAIGVLQVMPFNASRCGLAHAAKLWDEATNIDCGARILSEELATHKSIPDALRAYNGGTKCVRAKCSESEMYVVKVMSNVGKEALRG